jgi:hypothetical protein
MSADEIQSIRDSLKRIETALMGDELGNRGVVPRLSDAEKKLEIHDRKFLQWGTILTVTGTIIMFIKDPLMAFLGLK